MEVYYELATKQTLLKQLIQFGSTVAGLHSFDNAPCWRSLKYVTKRFITSLLVFNNNDSQIVCSLRVEPSTTK